SLGSIQKLDRPQSEQVTTASIEAFQAYSLGQAQRVQGNDLASAPFLQHAIELDPNFAMANLQLFFVYGNSGENGRAVEYLAKAFALADHASEYEHFRIQGIYYRFVTGGLSKAADINQIITRTYPRDTGSHNQLAGIYNVTGEFEKALQELHAIPETANSTATLIATYGR